MKRSSKSEKVEVKKMRQCLIGKTSGNKIEVSGADGWLGKGAVITRKLHQVLKFV